MQLGNINTLFPNVLVCRCVAPTDLSIQRKQLKIQYGAAFLTKSLGMSERTASVYVSFYALIENGLIDKSR